MIQLIQKAHVGKTTVKMGTEFVSLPKGEKILPTDVGKVLRYRRERPVNRQLTIIVRQSIGG